MFILFVMAACARCCSGLCLIYVAVSFTYFRQFLLFSLCAAVSSFFSFLLWTFSYFVFFHLCFSSMLQFSSFWFIHFRMSAFFIIFSFLRCLFASSFVCLPNYGSSVFFECPQSLLDTFILLSSWRLSLLSLSLSLSLSLPPPRRRSNFRFFTFSSFFLLPSSRT